MAYRRYIKRGNKIYGPYIQHNRKEDGKVITEYLGKGSVTKKSNNFFLAVFALFGFLALFLLFYFLNMSLTGNIILQMDDSYSGGENLNGYFSFILEKEEFIPASTKILINASGEIHEFPLSEFIEQPSEGTFYIKGTNISGNGLGYGTEASVVDFILRIYDKTELNETSEEEPEEEPGEEAEITEETNETGINQPGIPEDETAEINQSIANGTGIIENETVMINQTEENIPEQQTGENKTLPEPQENETSETSEETEEPDETTQEEPEETEQETSEENETESGAGITGSVIGSLAKITSKLFFTITGHAISGINIEGQVSKGEKFVYNISEGQSAEVISSSNDVDIIVGDNQITVTTNHTSDKREIILNLENLEVPAREGKLRISLVYNKTELASFEKEISVANKSVILNKTNITAEALSEIIGEKTRMQFKAVIHRPVKWIEVINTTNESIRIEVPKEAKNITIKKGEEVTDSLKELEEYEDRIKEADRNEFVSDVKNRITGDVSSDIGKTEGFLTRLFYVFSEAVITGEVISEEQIKENITETSESKVIEISTGAENESIAVEYYTGAPMSNETNISGGKRIVVYAPDEFNYSDVLAYTLIDEKIRVDRAQKIKLYWYASEKDAFRYGYISRNADADENETQVNITQTVQIQTNQTSLNETNSANESINETNQPDNYNNTISENNNSSDEIGNNSVNEAGNDSNEDSGNSPITGLITGFAVDSDTEEEQEETMIKTEIDFDAYDLDEDGYIDYIEWLVPHLSIQVYEVVIEISKAEHLDKDKVFISDITEEVEHLDGLWSENIGDEEYVRVYFMENLTSGDDITIFARATNYTDNFSEIEIYSENEKIAIIEDIGNGAYYKAYLANLSNSQNVLDLKVLGSGVEFDYVVDPSLEVVIDDSSDYLYMQNRTEASPHGARLETPVLFMDFNEENESNYIRDKSIYNNYGAINGNPVYNSSCASPIGDGGGCYEFDGNGDYISVADASSLDISEEVSVSAWINQRGSISGENQRITDKNGALTYWVNDTYGDVCVRLTATIDAGSQICFSTNLSKNQWYHVVFTYDWLADDRLKLYINGSLNATSNEYYGAMTANSNPLIIGDRAAGDRSFNGSVDNVQIWNRALEAWEIQNLYNGTYNASRYAGKYARTGNFSSFVYYNATAVYWNITASIADSDGEGLNLVNPDMVSYWSLDGDYSDKKGSNSGSCSAGECPHNSTGISSPAMEFDGVDDNIDCGSDSSLNISGRLSVSAWIYPREWGSDSTIIRRQNSYFMDINSGVNFRFFVYGYVPTSATVSVSDYNLNEWIHLVGVFNNETDNKIQLYINGKLKDNTTLIGWGSQTFDTQPFVIGSEQGASDFFNGSIDEVVIYNKSLSAGEVDELYKAGLSQHADTNLTLFVRTASSYNLSDSTLVSFWSFNEENADDEMGRNDGTVYGAAWMQQGGVVGGGYNFTDDDYIEVGETAELNPSILSIEFWFRPDADYGSGTDYVSLISHSYYEVYVDNGYMVFEYEGSRINSSTSAWNNEEWYHVFATYDGNVQTLYINSINESSAVAVLSAPFRIKNSAGTNVASFFNSGNLILKGKCFAAADCTYPSDDSFVIETSGATVAYVNSSGDLCIEDANCNDNDAGCNSPGDGSFIIQNSTFDNVAYINSTGNLCLIRTLTENGNP